ncbi:hypothetical protein HXT42_02800 [Gardnerella sp. DNF01192]|uniref:hypothetical protein n=1 Tax=Gardnerella sp. DNF01192 TaxID=2749064 RepID=UPI003BAB94D4
MNNTVCKKLNDNAETAEDINYTIPCVADFILSSAFSIDSRYDHSGLSFSERARRMSQKLAVIAWLDHAHIKHEAIEFAGTNDLPAFFMACTMQMLTNSKLIVGYKDKTQLKSVAASLPQNDLRRLQYKAATPPFFEPMRDYASYYKLLEDSVAANHSIVKTMEQVEKPADALYSRVFNQSSVFTYNKQY